MSSPRADQVAKLLPEDITLYRISNHESSVSLEAGRNKFVFFQTAFDIIVINATVAGKKTPTLFVGIMNVYELGIDST